MSEVTVLFTVFYAHLCAYKMNVSTDNKVFLTGADGLLGNNITRQLLKNGYQVKALFEKGKLAPTYDELPQVEQVFGSILDADEMVHLMSDCNYVIHAAANTTINPARSKMIVKVNVDGTANIIRAAIKNKITRLVFVGTANSFSPGSKAFPGDETNSYSGNQYQTDYMDSKYDAYLLVKKAFNNHLINGITVHPTFMIGPYDTRPSSGAMILAIYNKKVPGYTKGGRNYIYVKDVATAIVNGLTMGKSGESYILGNENLNYKEGFNMIAHAIGVKSPSIYFPPFITLIYGKIGDFIFRLFGKLPSVSYPMAQISCDDHYYSAEKAIRELQLPQTAVASIISEAFEWLKKNHINNV